MTSAIDAPAWSSLLMGLAALFAGIGALRKPGTWQTMIAEIEKSPTLQFLCGMLELVVGGIVYLACPWAPSDLLSCLMKAIGGLMIFESLAIIGFCDVYSQLWIKYLSSMHRGWALFTLVFGLALTSAGMLRFH